MAIWRSIQQQKNKQKKNKRQKTQKNNVFDYELIIIIQNIDEVG
jgi:hypothetical protein